MGLTGSLKTMPPVDLLRLFSLQKSTGMLELNREGVRRNIFFENGGIISADSSEPIDFLGHFLVSFGKITEDQLARALAMQQKTKKILGKTLITMGVLTESGLAEMMEVKCRELVLAVFFWEDADFEFYDDRPPPVRLIPTPLDVEPIVQTGIRRSEEYVALRRMYPSRGICFERTSSGADDPILRDPFVRMVYGFVNGKQAVREIILQTHSTEYRIFKCLHILLQKGLVGILDPNKEPTQIEDFRLKGAEMLKLSKTRLSEGKFEEAINILRFSLKQNAESKETKDLLSQAEESLVRKVYEDFSPESVPGLAKTMDEIMAGERLSSEESFIMSRINGQWDVKSILTITPLPEVDVLRIFKKLRDRKIIQFS